MILSMYTAVSRVIDLFRRWRYRKVISEFDAMGKYIKETYGDEFYAVWLEEI